jgi:hypothetical protein
MSQIFNFKNETINLFREYTTPELSRAINHIR